MIKLDRRRGSPGRRWLALCSVVLLGATASWQVATRPGPAAAAAEFDFDNGHAALEVILPRVGVQIRSTISPDASDATLILRIAALMETSWFDAIAPYHPTAVGIYSRLGRRPAQESTTRNKNIAMLYASYRTLNSLIPQGAAEWRDMMTSVGLDPDDSREDTDTAIGLGNRAGNSVIASRVRDGMNQLGDEGGREYNRQPYADYLGYQPVNTAYQLRNPSRWQPGVVTTGNGLFQVQEFATPQMRKTKPYSYRDPNEFHAPAPTASDYHRNRQAYQRQAEEVLAASATLNDERKLKAEFFNDKFASLGVTTNVIAQNRGLSLDQYVHYHLMVDIAAFDTAIAVWNDKYIYDAVRPFSAVRHLYANKRVTAWGGPGRGTVTDLPGSQWRSYLNTANHPEYPSGSASFCAADAQASRRYFGSDEMGFSFRFAKGTSRIEPGLTPANDTVLTWATWTDFARDCGMSRLWGGVHFTSAINAGAAIGTRIGDRAYEFVQRHVDGVAGANR